MVWHILRKDLRRMAALIAVVWIAGAALAILDCLHLGVSLAPLLSFLLPLGWAALVAMAVQQEPLASDAAYWLTRPYGRGALVAAKLLFTAVTIHIPLGVFLAAIMWAHGVSPFASVFWEKQLLVLLAVTAPAWAMAAIANGGVALGLSVIVTAALTTALDRAVAGPRYAWAFGEWAPLLVGLSILAVGSAAIVASQYNKRRLRAARVAAAAAGTCAILASTLLPGDLSAALECSLAKDGAGSWAITMDSEREAPKYPIWIAPGQNVFAVPLQISGPEPALSVWVEPLSVRLYGGDGMDWSARRPRHGDWEASIRTFGSESLFYQAIWLDQGLLAERGRNELRLDGRASVRPSVAGAAVEFAVPARHVPVAGIGTCSAEPVTLVLGRAAVQVTCESAKPIGAMTEVTLLATNANWSKSQSIGYSPIARAAGPNLSWLSPLDARQTLIEPTGIEATGIEATGLTGDNLKHIRVRITPAIPRGCVNVAYSFNIRDLSRWRMSR
ncbi:MAG: hypothetical protein IT168_32625 [Bryobacterales bacterium]|nr:hypothetical protein [Bryobacterales bacterium]